MNFKLRNFRNSPPFLSSYIIKLSDKTFSENFYLVSKAVNSFLPSAFNNYFAFSSDTHQYETLFSTKGVLKITNNQY